MADFDWMLWSIEGCGILILCIWITIPIREFRQIARRLRQRDKRPQSETAGPPASENEQGED